MANRFYGKGRQKFGESAIHWVNDTIKAVLVDAAAYTPDIDVDEFLSDIPLGARIATSPAFANKTNVLGVFDADDIQFSNVTGPTCEYLAVYKDTGAAGTSPLIALFDTVTGLPVTPGGGHIIIQWDNGQYKIMML